MRKNYILLSLAIVCLSFLTSGCVQQRKAAYSGDILVKIEKIELMQGEPTKSYIELGIVEHKFNPLDGKAEVEFTLREQAYSKYGNIDAIIRITQTMVTGYQFPLNLIRGMAIKFIR
ncbi:hypothetical protein IBX65_08025 [Candidatus Aerophobetes bacterium]|nr:hypothetical protein [Candidatus Aerophobetes bacterium]